MEFSDTAFKYSLHKELWTWMSENPGNWKSEWPGWYNTPIQVAHCFACQYKSDIGFAGSKDSKCITCPLVWPGDACGLYEDWGMAYQNEDVEMQKELAKQIAELPVREGVFYI